MSLIRRYTCLLILLGCCSASALAQVPDDFAISPSDIYQFECYYIYTGNAQWMTLDIQYRFSGGGGGTIWGWPSLDGSGRAEICTNESTVPGTYTFTAIKNTENSTWVAVDASVSVYLVPAPDPDYSLSISPASRTVNYGQATSYTVSIIPQNNFGDAVSLSLNGRPPGASSSFAPAVIYPGQSATLTINTSSTTIGAYGSFPLTVVGVGGGLTRTASAGFSINPPPQPTSLSFSAQEGYAGSDSYTLHVGNGSNMTVDLSYRVDNGPTLSTTVALNSNGDWLYALDHYSVIGTFIFTAIKNHWRTDSISLSPAVTYKVLPPKPTSLSISPTTVTAGSGSYTMTVGHGANVTLDVQYMLDNVQQPSISGWPNLTPAAPGSATGIQTVPVGHCFTPGTYSYTAIKNTLNTAATWQPVNSSVTVISTPNVSSVNPTARPRGSTAIITINGANLCNASLSTTWPGLTFSNVTSNGSSASATLTIASTAWVGNAPITINATYGSRTFNFEIANSLPPTVTSITPVSSPRGSTVTISMIGNNLTGASLSSNWSGLTFTNVTATNDGTSLAGTFVISAPAAGGNPPIQVTTSAGQTTTQLFNIIAGPIPIREYISIDGRLLAVDPPP
jgi:hypothetical protein